jgi:Putative transposase
MVFHPHVHCLASGGGISEDADTWHPARNKFLVPIKALVKLVRGKFRALLQRKCPDLVIPDALWRVPWILHVTAWGNGECQYRLKSPRKCRLKIPHFVAVLG